MKKLVIGALALMFLLPLLASLSLQSAAASSTVGTYAVEVLGQAGHGGGSLDADGTLGGGASYVLGNGAFVGKFLPTTWSFVNGGTAVLLCFNVQVLKGPPVFPSPFCLGGPVTGTPVIVDGILFRVTLNP